MASGLAVLELESECTQKIYPSETVTLAGPHPIDIANKLNELLKDGERRSNQARAAQKWVGQFSWDQLAHVVESAVLERLSTKGYLVSTPVSTPNIVKEVPKASLSFRRTMVVNYFKR